MSDWLYYRPFEEAYAFPEVQADGRPGYNKVAEWYLTGCLAFLLIDGVFAATVASFAGSGDYLVSRITGYAIMPTEIYFLSVGLIIGLVIFLVGRSSEDYVPTMGVWSLLAYWAVHLMGTVRGYFRGNGFWYLDSRALLLTTIVVPWAAVIGQKVRLDVVLKRVIWIALPLAVVNASRGYTFISMGPRVSWQMNEQTAELGMDLRSDLALLAVYLFSLARSFSRGGRGFWITAILAVGVVGPLSKPTVFAFIVSTLALMLIGTYTGTRSGVVGFMRANIAFLVLGLALSAATALWLNQRGGTALDFLLERFFKASVDISRRDLSTGRFGAWSYALDVWQTSPFIGVGLGTRVPKLGRGIPFIVYHNQWIKILAEMGLVGIIVVMGGFLLWFRRAWKGLVWETTAERFWPRLGLTCFVLAIAASSVVGEPLGSYTLAYLFWFAVALESAAHSQVLRGHAMDEEQYASQAYVQGRVVDGGYGAGYEAHP